MGLPAISIKMSKLNFEQANDVKEVITGIINKLDLNYINPDNIVCFRSSGTTSRNVHARCWSLPNIWQQALCIDPHYIIEVISEKFDKLDLKRRKMVLVHELMHIPKTFSGALRPHNAFLDDSYVLKLCKRLEEIENKEENKLELID